MMKNEFESDLRSNERFLSSSENKAWKKFIIRSSHICIHTFSYLILKKKQRNNKNFVPPALLLHDVEEI